VGTQGGLRCTFGNWACTAGCVALGQTSGEGRVLNSDIYQPFLQACVTMRGSAGALNHLFLLTTSALFFPLDAILERLFVRLVKNKNEKAIFHLCSPRVPVIPLVEVPAHVERMAVHVQMSS
jgi:hypothetical protein